MTKFLLFLIKFFCLLLWGQHRDTVLATKFWPTEREVKEWLSVNFPSRDIAYRYNDTCWVFYTFLESTEFNLRKEISIQQGRRFWNKAEVRLKNDSVYIHLSNPGVQNKPDGNTPNPKIEDAEHIQNQMKRKLIKGKDIVPFEKLLENINLSQAIFFEKIVLWFTLSADQHR